MFTQVCSRLLGCNRLRCNGDAADCCVSFAAGNYPQPGTWNWPPYMLKAAICRELPAAMCG
jgi:hypothetical protein